MKVSFSLSSIVLDYRELMKEKQKDERKFLMRFGAYVRRVARNSIKKPKKRAKRKPLPSPPGEPPRTLDGRLKGGIRFAYDSQKHSVAIGPEKLKSGNTPEILEYGGTGFSQFEKKSFKHSPRPYMTPAFHQTFAKTKQFWSS